MRMYNAWWQRYMRAKALSTVAIIVAEFGDCRRIRLLQSPVWTGFNNLTAVVTWQRNDQNVICWD